MNINVNRRTVSLVANGSNQIDVSGSFLLLYSSTGSFNFSIDGSPMSSGFCVLSIDLRNAYPGAKFKSVQFQDTSGSANTISCFISDAPISYAQIVPTVLQQDAPTVIKATSLSALGATTWSTVFSGVSASGKARKHFILSNLDSSANMHIGDGTTPGILCPAGQSRIVATSGALYVYNAGSNPANAEVLEVFYV